MGAIIKAYSLSGETTESSYLRSGASAVRACLEQAQAGMKELGLLINAGVYRDRHIHEPAFASLIHGELLKDYRTKLAGTFSFDLHCGGGGVVMALRILNGLLESGKTDYGAVVAGDAEPFDGSAGAMMVGKGTSGEGFQMFYQDIYTRFSSEYQSYSNNSGNAVQITNKQSTEYINHCVQSVKKSLDRFIARASLAADEIDLIIPSQFPDGFAAALAESYGTGRVVVLNGEQNCYSAGLILAMSQATSLFRKSGKVLFVHVGPGISIDLALYFIPS